MKKTNLAILTCLLISQVAKAQQYLPLTGGTLTGNLIVSSGNQIQAPFYGFNAGTPQPASSGTVAIFPNSNTNTLDLIGWTSGWRFIPQLATYPAPVVTIDNAGNTYFAGKMGIGVSNPSDNFEVAAPSGNLGVRIATTSNTAGDDCAVRFYQGGTEKGVIYTSQENLYLNRSGSGNVILAKTGGNVLIGEASQVNPSYLLDVAGNIRSKGVVVNTTGADFVFGRGYSLPSLSDVNDFIKDFHHLPGIAPAAWMQTNGLSLGEISTQLLQKVEELTLYAIEADKRLTCQDTLVTSLQSTVEQQQALLVEFQAQLKSQQEEIDRLKAQRTVRP